MKTLLWRRTNCVSMRRAIPERFRGRSHRPQHRRSGCQKSPPKLELGVLAIPASPVTFVNVCAENAGTHPMTACAVTKTRANVHVELRNRMQSSLQIFKLRYQRGHRSLSSGGRSTNKSKYRLKKAQGNITLRKSSSGRHQSNWHPLAGYPVVNTPTLSVPILRFCETTSGDP